jgi:hypothetical protein
MAESGTPNKKSGKVTSSTSMTQGKIVLPLALALLVVVFIACNNADQVSQVLNSSFRKLKEGGGELSNIQDDTAALQALSEKLTPKEFLMEHHKGLLPKQFIHLHHMKTAGNSMDHLLKCGMERYRRVQSVDISYANIHECSKSHYEKCLSGNNQSCNSRIQKAAFMSYCVPLKDLPKFVWNIQDVQLVTVL